MFKKLSDWLDDRTGYRKLRDAMLLEHIPGGAKWRYVWGSALAFVFMIQLTCPCVISLRYSPYKLAPAFSYSIDMHPMQQHGRF